MLPGMELMGCTGLAVPADVMRHVVQVESSFNPYAIGVVGGRLARQPRSLDEAVATARMLEARGLNFSLGLAQVNRYNLGKYGLGSYEKAFSKCANLQAGSRILAECHGRSGRDWGKAFSCYYSGNFETGFRHGYVQKIYASMGHGAPAYPGAIPVITNSPRGSTARRRPAGAAPALVRAPAWMQRTEAVSRAQPVVPPAALPTAPAPSPEVAVLDAAGGPARLIPAAAVSLDAPQPAALPASAPTLAPATPTPTPTLRPADTAFVF